MFLGDTVVRLLRKFRTRTVFILPKMWQISKKKW